MEIKERIEFPGLPLAVYREIAAHLRQVEGVQVSFIPQSSQEFDYQQSQIGGLWMWWSSHPSPESQQRIEQILAYYRSLYTTS
jgi:hypothetical protein